MEESDKYALREIRIGFLRARGFALVVERLSKPEQNDE